MPRIRSSLLIAFSVLMLLAMSACSSGGSNEEPEPEPPEDTTPPGVPSGLEASSGDAEVALEWSAVSASDLDGYNVYRSTSSIGSVSDQSSINDAPLEDPSFTDAGVSNGTTYFYRVTAVDESSNESDGSSEVEVTPFPTPPDRP